MNRRRLGSGWRSDTSRVPGLFLKLAPIIVHLSRLRVLWIDLDGSKEAGVGAVAYYTKDDARPNENNVEPVCFF